MESDYLRTQQLLADNDYTRSFEHDNHYRHESFDIPMILLIRIYIHRDSLNLAFNSVLLI